MNEKEKQLIKKIHKKITNEEIIDLIITRLSILHSNDLKVSIQATI